MNQLVQPAHGGCFGTENILQINPLPSICENEPTAGTEVLLPFTPNGERACRPSSTAGEGVGGLGPYPMWVLRKASERSQPCLAQAASYTSGRVSLKKACCASYR